MLHSGHGELLYEAVEDITDFRDALEAEPDRRRGFRIPKNARNSDVEALFCRDVWNLREQITRYLDVSGQARVHVVVFDDLLYEPERVAREFFEFLGVDPGFLPERPALNAHKPRR